MEQLRGWGLAKSNRSKLKGYSLPIELSDFFACHHFPCLSTISKISPLENDISLASSGDAVSRVHLQIKTECETVLTRTCIQRLCPVWVRRVRSQAGISRQRGSTICTDACIARVFIRCELTPSGPFVFAPRALRESALVQGWPGRR